jgi:thiamine biosynthesis lipoprotein
MPNRSTPAHEKRLHVFGSACHILVGRGDPDGPDPLEIAQNELGRLEARFASFCPDSIIDSINQKAGTGVFTPLDDESRSLFSYVTALWDQSNHLFDPTTRVLVECYDRQGKLQVTADRLQGLLKLVGWSGLEVTSRGARLLTRGLRINLDNCVRPYAIDSVRKLLLRTGVTNALIEMNQDVASIGKQPDGANWLVGVRHPKGTQTAIARLKLNGRGFAMRGNFEHRLMIAGENFGRALSPVDAQPLPGLLSVAVIAESCLTACGAASVARLKTEQAGLRWLEKLGLPWMAIDRELNCHGPLAPP